MEVRYRVRKESSFRKLARGLCVSGVMILGLVGQDAMAVELGDKAQRYFDVLGKRPFSSYLFDRFYNAALDELSINELQGYLQEQVQNTDTSENRLFLAYYFARQGDDEQALAQYDQALSKNPDHPELLLLKAQTQARVLNFEQALANLNSALEHKPSPELAQRIAKLQGRLYLRTSQQDQAHQVWENLLSANPDDADLYQELIELQITEGLYDQAVQTSLKLIEKTTDLYQKVVRQLRLGDIYQRAAFRDKALDVYSNALMQVGSDTWIEKEICSQIEQVFRHEDDITGLKDYFATLQQTQPQRLELRKRHASLLAELGQNDEAIKAFEAILKLTPGDRDNREQYVAMLLAADRRKDAISQLQSLVKDNPSDSTLAFHLAEQLLEDDQADTAREILDDYLKLSDQSEYAFMRVIRLLERRKMFDQVASMYQRLMTIRPESLSAREAYASYLFTQKQNDQAVAMLTGIADRSDRQGLLRIARQLIEHAQADKAFELLQSRFETFQTDLVYLSDLCQVAMNLKAYDQAMPWARSAILLCSSPTELEAAIKMTVRLAKRGDLLDELKKDLENKVDRVVNETCLLAYLYEQTGQVHQSDTLLAKSLPADSLIGRYMQVRFFVMRNDYSSAADAMEKLVLLPEGRKSTYLRQLVELYQRDMNLEKALGVIPRWKELSPGSSLPYSIQAKLLDMQGQTKEAIHVLRGACLKFEREESLLTQLAQMYQSAGQFADARRVYLNLYESDTSLTGKLRWVRMMGQIANQYRQLDGLIQTFIQRRDHNRQAVEPYLALAELYRIANQYEERRQALLQASHLKGKDVALVMAIAEIEEQEGHWQQALKTLASARDIDQKGYVVRRMATLHFLYGDESEGYRLLYEAAGGRDLDADGVVQLADTMLSRSDWQAAVRFLNEHRAEYPKDYRLGYQLLVALVEDMQYQAAIHVAMQLLDCDEEIPAKNNQSQTAMRLMRISDYYGKIMPPASLDLLQQTWMSYTIFQYRQRQNMSVSPGSHGGRATAISLPPDLEGVKTFVISHMQEVAKYLEDEPRKMLQEQLVDHGIANAPLILAMDTKSLIHGNGAMLLPLLEQYPEDEGLLGMAALMGMQQRVPIDDAINIRIYKHFFDTYPVLSFSSSIGLLRNGHASAGQFFDTCLDKLQKNPEPNVFLLQAMAQLLRSAPVGITEDHKAKITQLLLQWYDKAADSPQLSNSPWVFYLVANALSQEKNPAKVIAFFDDEIDRSSNPNHMPGVRQTYAAMQNNLPLINLPVWPPVEIDNFPSHVLQLFSSQRNPYGSVFQMQSLDIDALAKVIDKARHPMLKMLFLHMIGDEKSLAQIDEMIAAQLKATRPKALDFYLASIRAIEMQKPMQAIDLLCQTRFLDQSQLLRQQIDTALVALVMDTPDCDTKYQDAARSALLRLRAARMPANRRAELITAMESLGMTKQAKALERMTQSQSASRAVNSSHVYSGRAAVTSIDKLKDDLKQGHRDMVVLRAGRQLESLLASRQNVSGYWGRNHELMQIVSFIKSSDIKQDIIDRLSGRKDGAGNRAITMAGLVCAELGQTDEAKRLFELVIQQNTNDINARYALFELLAKDDLQQAMQAFDGINERSREQLLQNLLQQIAQNSFNDNLEQLYACSDALATLLKKQQTITPQMASQFENVFNRLNSQVYQSGTNLPLMYESPKKSASTLAWRGEQSSRSIDSRMQKQIDWRARVHTALCDQLLKHKLTASTAFTHKLAADMSQEKVDEKAFTQLAIQVLTMKPIRRYVSIQPNVVQYYSSQNNQVPMVSPTAYLVGVYARQQQLDQLAADLMPKLDDPLLKDTAEHLRKTIELYQCDPSAYMQLAEKILNDTYGKTRMIQDVSTVNLILQVCKDRQLDVPIHELVFKPFAPKSRLRVAEPYVYRSVLRQWLDDTLDRDQDGAYLKALHQLADALLGPVEKREEAIRRHYDQNMRMGGDNPNARIHLFVELLNQDMNNDATFLTAYSVARVVPSSNLPHYAQNCQRTAEAFFKLLKKKEKWDVLINQLARMPLMADEMSFDTVAMTTGNQSSALEMFVKEARALPEEQQQAFVSELEKKSNTFGRGLLVSLLAREPKQVFDYLVEHQSQLDVINPEHLAGLGRVLEQVTTKQDQDKLSADAKALLVKFLENDKSQQADEAQEILKLRMNTSLTRDMWSLAKRIALAIKPLAHTDRPLAMKLVDKGMTLYQQAQRSGQFNVGSNNIEDWFLGRLLDEVDGNDDSRLSMLGVILQYCQENDRELSMRYGNASYYLGRIWDLAYRKNRKDLPKAFTVFYESLQTNFGEIEQSPLAQSYLSAVMQIKKPADFQKIEAWLERLAQSQKADPVADELNWYFNLQKTLQSEDQVKIDAFMEQSMLPRLDDKSVMVDSRFAMACRIGRECKQFNSVKFNRAILNLLSELITSDGTLKHQDLSYTLRQLASEEPRAEDWQQAVKTATASVNAYCLKQNRLRSRGNSPFNFRSDFMSELMQLNEAVSQQDDNNQMARICMDQLSADVRLWVSLLNLNQTDAAVAWLVKNWEAMRPNRSHGTVKLVLDDDYNKASEALLAGIEAPDLKVLARVMLLIAPKHNERKQAAQSSEPSADPVEKTYQKDDYEKAVLQMADLVLATDFRSSDMMDLALEHLIQVPKAGRHLAPTLSERLKSTDGLALLTDSTNSGRESCRMKLWLTYMCNELAASRFEPLEKCLDQFESFSGDSYRLYRAKRQLTDTWRQAVYSDHMLDKADKQQLAMHLAMLRQLVGKKVQQSYLNYRQDFHAMLIGLDVLVNDTPTHDQWLTDSDPYVRKEVLRGQTNSQSMIRMIDVLCRNQMLADSPTEKLAYLQKLASLHSIGSVKLPELRIDTNKVAKWFDKPLKELVSTDLTQQQVDELVAAFNRKPLPEPKSVTSSVDNTADAAESAVPQTNSPVPTTQPAKQSVPTTQSATP